jgi:hypothetical protein
LDISVKVNAFYYAVTGSILAYHFQNASNHLAKFALLLPIAFSFAIALVFLYGASQLRIVRQELFSIRDRLGLDTAPEMMVLILFLSVFGFIALGTGGSLAWFFSHS